MDGIFSGRLTLLVSVIAAAALAFTGLQLTNGGGDETSAASDLPTPPTYTVDEAADGVLDGADDGLNHFVVALADPTEQVDGVGTEAATVQAPESSDTEIEFLDRDDPAYLEEQALSASDRELLEQLQGLEDGTVAAPVAAPAGFDVDDLVAVDGIESVTPAGPGYAGVATSLNSSQLAALGGVAGVQADPLRGLAASYYPFQWGLENNDHPTADIRWDVARTVADGSGVVVAVVDTGVDTDHPDLASQLWSNPGETCDNGVDDDANGYVDDCTGWDFANNDNSVDDADADNNHGTHVAGIIAANDDSDLAVGVAPAARIMPLKIFHNGASNSSRLAAAVNYAVDNGADVINLSLGGSETTDAERDAIQRASDAGLAIVVASGNERLDTDRSASYPANHDMPGVISVGSSDIDDRKSGFSNYGRYTVDLFAPGGEILSSVDDGHLGYMSGTSMAAPFVAGTAALLAQTGVTGEAARARMMETAMPLVDLESRALTNARLDAAYALGVPRGRDTDETEVVFLGFHDMNRAIEDEAEVLVRADHLDHGATTVTIRGTLGIDYNDAIYSVVNYDVVTEHGFSRTDENGQFLLHPEGGLSAEQLSEMRSGGVELPVGFELPTGNYAMAIEIVNTDSGEVLADPSLIFFEVGQADLAVEDHIVIGDQPIIDTPDAEEVEDGVTTAPDGTPAAGGDVSTSPGAPGVNLVSPGDTVDDVVDTVDGLPVVGEDGLDVIGTIGGVTDSESCLVGLALQSKGNNGNRGNGNGNRGNGNANNGNALGLGEDRGRGNNTGFESDAAPEADGSALIQPIVSDDSGPTGGDAREDATEEVQCAVDAITEIIADILDEPVDQLPPGTVEDVTDILDDADGITGADDIVDRIEDVIGVDLPAVEDVFSGDGESGEGILVEGVVNPDIGGPDTTSVSVTIPSGIPAGSFVKFGESNAPITSRLSDTRVLVSPPAHAPGVVDVAVLTPAGQRYYMADAYTFTDAEGEVPAPDTSDITVVTGPDAEDTTTDGESGLDQEVGQDGTATGGGAASGAGPSDAETEDEVSDVANGGAAAPAGPRVHNYAGLQLMEMTDGPLAGISRDRTRTDRCKTDVCAARA